MRTVVVLSGGPSPSGAFEVPVGATVVTANGGAALARELDLEVDLAVGDFDSVGPAELAHVRAVERYPEAKDATDLELAMQAALRFDPERVLVIGSGGGRLDHLLGGLLLLGSAAYAGIQVDARVGDSLVHVVRSDRSISGAKGELISLFAVNGDATGVATEGLLYPLRRETLEAGSSRGVSNVFDADVARIRVEQGVLVAVRPAPEGLSF